MIDHDPTRGDPPSTTSVAPIAAAGRGPIWAGGVLCAVGLLLLATGPLAAGALGLELLAAAFWYWARMAEDARGQVPRWSWLRRPALALWLAAAIHLAFGAGARDAAPALRVGIERLEAFAVLWSALELLAALPLARRYSDLPGPLLAMRPWLPVLMPAAGFLVLWRHVDVVASVPVGREIAQPLLLLTAALAALRAFARLKWVATLRWLAVTDSALAALVVARGVVPRETSLLLWLAACGGHAFLLAGELRGAIPRRGSAMARLWRGASWAALIALSWPAVLTAGVPGARGLAGISWAVAAGTVALVAWVTVGRMVAAPERRLLTRPDPVMVASQLLALAVLVVVPVALVRAWWMGFEPRADRSALALAPAVLGGLLALAARQGKGRALWSLLRRAGAGAPAASGWLFRRFVDLERHAVALFERALRGVTAPLHDLHTGDAQEYLLFLAGLAVLALVAPLLQ